MKVLVLVIAAVIGAVIIGVSVVEFARNQSSVQIETIPPGISPQVSIIAIPKDISNTTAVAKPFALSVVIGVNNTVRWTNGADFPVTIVADTYDDPGFVNATGVSASETNPSNEGNQILPGQSFEYTFTKGGVFVYHERNHPWFGGAVVVWPHAEILKPVETLNQTEILSRADTVNPCLTFQIPCQNIHDLVAEKLDSGVYIENMTVNGFEYYDIVHPTYSCLYPMAVGNSCFYPENVQLMESIGAKEIPFIRAVPSAYQGPDSWWWPKTAGCAKHGGEDRCISDLEQVMGVIPKTFKRAPGETTLELTFVNDMTTPVTSLNYSIKLSDNSTIGANNITAPTSLEGHRSISEIVTIPDSLNMTSMPIVVSGVSNTIPFKFTTYFGTMS